MRKVATVVLGLMLFAATAGASPLSYDEAVDGDLNGQVLQFDLGVNTIAGSISYHLTAPTDFDLFRFVIPDGAELTAWTVKTEPVAGVGRDLGRQLNLVVFNGPFLGFDAFPLDFSEVTLDLFLHVLPLGPGTYVVGDFTTGGAIGGPGDDQDNHVWNYTFSFTVSAVAVPEPASIALLGAGLAGLAFVRRRSGWRNSD